MEWLHTLPHQKQDEVLELACAQQSEVSKERQKEDKRRCQLRKEKMLQANKKMQAGKQKKEEASITLSKIDLITSAEELRNTIKSIDGEYCSTNAKNAKKTKLLRNQIDIRKNC